MDASKNQWVTRKISDSEIVDAIRAAGRPLQRDELFVRIFLARCDTHDCTKKESQRLLRFYKFIRRVDTQSFFSLFWEMMSSGVLYLDSENNLERIGLQKAPKR